MPSASHRHSGRISAEPANAASTCSQIPCFRQIAAIARTGSMAVEPVVPIAATTQSGVKPSLMSRGDGSFERCNVHCIGIIDRDLSQEFLPDTGDLHGLFDGGMCFR